MFDFFFHIMKASTLHINPFWKTHIFGLLLGNVNCLRPEIHFESISLDAVSHISLHFDCKILVNHMYVMFVFQNPQKCITKLQGQNTQTCFLVLFLKARPMTKIFMSNWMILVYQTALKALPKNWKFHFSRNYSSHKFMKGLSKFLPTLDFCRLCLEKCLKNLPKQTFSRR